jgi:hypothetical protein
MQKREGKNEYIYVLMLHNVLRLFSVSWLSIEKDDGLMLIIG